jgi:hypothetical protein
MPDKPEDAPMPPSCSMSPPTVTRLHMGHEPESPISTTTSRAHGLHGVLVRIDVDGYPYQP